MGSLRRCTVQARHRSPPRFEAPAVDLQFLRSRNQVNGEQRPAPARHGQPAPPTAAPGQAAETEPILRLQRLAGNRAVREALGSGQPPVPVQRRRRRAAPKAPTADERRHTRATALKGADARGLLKARLPFALSVMTEAQVGQMQRVLDATVVNPEVEKEAAALDRKSVIRDFGYRQDRDPKITRQADRVRKDYLKIREGDRRIRLDHTKLLTRDALSPRTDNPDEASYLNRVAFTLEKRGIYLRFNPKPMRDPEDPSVWTIDPRNFDTWLSLGPEGGVIPTNDGRIDRDALLKTQLLGAGYYENVSIGPAQSTLKREIKRLENAIELGIEHHTMLQKIRDGAFPGVAETVDLFGGADFPDTSSFDRAHKFVVRALELNVSGNLAGSRAYLVVASAFVRNGALLLKQYLDDTNSGGERALTVLKVAKVAGEVAGVALAVTGVPGLVRGGVRLAAGETGAAAAADIQATAAKVADEYIATAGHTADELRVIRAMKGPKGSVAGGVKPGTSAGAGQGFHKLY
jgi:hypothetical protein